MVESFLGGQEVGTCVSFAWCCSCPGCFAVPFPGVLGSPASSHWGNHNAGDVCRALSSGAGLITPGRHPLNKKIITGAGRDLGFYFNHTSGDALVAPTCIKLQAGAQRGRWPCSTWSQLPHQQVFFFSKVIRSSRNLGNLGLGVPGAMEVLGVREELPGHLSTPGSAQQQAGL